MPNDIENYVPAVKYRGLNTSKDVNLKGTTTITGGLNKGLVAVPDASTYTVLASNSGRTHVVPDLGQDIVISLPTPASGLEYTFVYKGVAADTSDWQLDTGSDTNFYLGGILVFDDTAGDEVGFFAPDGDSNSKFNVLTPNIGTQVTVLCDGTNWIVSGVINSETDATFANQA